MSDPMPAIRDILGMPSEAASFVPEESAKVTAERAQAFAWDAKDDRTRELWMNEARVYAIIHLADVAQATLDGVRDALGR